MKILKKGKGGKRVHTAKWECDECGSLIESTNKEGKYVSDWRDGDYFECKCPSCGHVNNVAATLFQP